MTRLLFQRIPSLTRPEDDVILSIVCLPYSQFRLTALTLFPWRSRLRWKIAPPTFNFAMESGIPPVRRTVSAEARPQKEDCIKQPLNLGGIRPLLNPSGPLSSSFNYYFHSPIYETKFTSEYLPVGFPRC